MFLLDATSDPAPFSASFEDITDKEGNEVPRSEISVSTRVSDPSVLGTSYDESSDSGEITFGAPGEASWTIEAVDKDDPTEILATKSYAFKLVAGDPSSIGAINVNFPTISEQPEVPPVVVESSEE